MRMRLGWSLVLLGALAWPACDDSHEADGDDEFEPDPSAVSGHDDQRAADAGVGAGSALDGSTRGDPGPGMPGAGPGPMGAMDGGPGGPPGEPRHDPDASKPHEPKPDGGPMPKPDGGPMPKPDGGPMPQHDGGPMPQHDGGPMPKPDGGPMPKPGKPDAGVDMAD
jgi:hypothetical protein